MQSIPNECEMRLVVTRQISVDVVLSYREILFLSLFMKFILFSFHFVFTRLHSVRSPVPQVVFKILVMYVCGKEQKDLRHLLAGIYSFFLFVLKLCAAQVALRVACSLRPVTKGDFLKLELKPK